MTTPAQPQPTGINEQIDPDAHSFGDQGTRTYGSVGMDGTVGLGVEKSVFKGKQVGTSMSKEIKISPVISLGILAALAAIAFLVWLLFLR